MIRVNFTNYFNLTHWNSLSSPSIQVDSLYHNCSSSTCMEIGALHGTFTIAVDLCISDVKRLITTFVEQ